MGKYVATASDSPLKNKPLSDQARDRLRAAIFEGDLKPGDKINIERIAETFGISRTPIREALKALETEGLIEIQTNRGAVVQADVWEEIHHRYQMRGLLEGYAAELSCTKASESLIDALRKNCAEARLNCDVATNGQLDALQNIAALNRSFHRIIWAGSGSTILVRFLEALDLPQSFNNAIYTNERARNAVSCQHDAILKAFEQGDSAKARSLMENHIVESADLLADSAEDQAHKRTC